MFLSILNNAFDQNADLIATADWRAEPGADIDAGAPLGTAAMVPALRFQGIGFAVTDTGLTGPGVLDSSGFTPPANKLALRVDEVAFPPGAIAHRHTHSGSGWRHLVSGALRIEAEDGTETMQPGQSWFEPANSPVRATALQTHGVTRFVRAMVIPLADLGRSTFCLCDARDADLPRLQVTHRHLDHTLQVDAG